jgi:outer membrane protein OmpA-like peptidoglycan-associated protein
MNSKVRVYGKAQNRTALGIMHAYLVMYPHATIEDFRKAFPLEISGWDAHFRFKKDLDPVKDPPFWFCEKDELLKLQDGSEVSFLRMWTKPSFEKLVEHAKQYGIEIAEFEKGEKGSKGGFRLEYLNGYVPPVPVVKSSKTWLWVLLASVVIIGILLAILLTRGCNREVVEVEKVVVVHDTLYIKQIEEIEKDYNAAEFIQGKSDLSESAKFVLHDLAKVMRQHPEIRLLLEGHTSAEGDSAFNQKLSEDRAGAAVKFMVEHEGIDASRLEAVGKGSSELKNAADPTAAENRRTEFIVIE